MNLSLGERVLLLDLLPKEGEYAGLKELRKAKEWLSITPDERAEFEVTQTQNIIRWNDKGNAYLSDIPLSEYVTTLIQELLRKRNKDKQLREIDISLYEKFIVGYDQV
jgi:hypothetical protein